ncbi:2OG-Fe(II) oxygenase family protein [Roseomonas populi]|uniref:2OG-Fe(II) oxygenase family protein n=1 Tax=Roseomonas populi TaxID=3121582 RepID=A0ABT1X0G9_9PROT|nr:2OG-Fe(II) oxygenase family protein [Roseomonas pecuniae]MCR0981592.1 2OG-Fe(II) oxygenase family protein [Roseomonas pecuniae]
MENGSPADLFPVEPLTFSATGFRLRHVFPTPLLVAPVNDAAALNARLRPAILARAAREGGVVRSNDGGWQSTDDFWSWSGPAGAALLEAATSLANRFTALRTPEGAARGGVVNWRSNAWANVNGESHANHPHHHPGAFWSGVYWVDAGDEAPEDGGEPGFGGEFEMHDPRGILPGFSAPQLRMAIPGCLSAGLTDYVAPQTGTMLVFPAWLVHGVRRYTGIRPRISVAFNLSA